MGILGRMSHEVVEKRYLFRLKNRSILTGKKGEVEHMGMRPASPMVRRKRDFFEWEFTKKMNAVGQ